MSISEKILMAHPKYQIHYRRKIEILNFINRLDDIDLLFPEDVLNYKGNMYALDNVQHRTYVNKNKVLTIQYAESHDGFIIDFGDDVSRLKMPINFNLNESIMYYNNNLIIQETPGINFNDYNVICYGIIGKEPFPRDILYNFYNSLNDQAIIVG